MACWLRKTMEQLQEKIRYHQLYDIYGALLTDKQRSYFSYYYFDDYSLSEIAKIMNVSRNAVFEQIKTVVGILDYYEDKLNVMKRRERRQHYFKQARSGMTKKQLAEMIDELEKIEGYNGI